VIVVREDGFAAYGAGRQIDLIIDGEQGAGGELLLEIAVIRLDRC
jgi:hypothetical protein